MCQGMDVDEWIDLRREDVLDAPYFHTVFWLYMLFPITWVIATVCNVVALAIFLAEDLKKLELSRENN